MTTNWVSPNYIIQFSEVGAEQVDVAWNNGLQFSQIINNNGTALSTIGQLKHISRSPKPDLKNKTYYLRATNFYFNNLPNVVSGIELKIIARRFGRVMDDVVQISLNDKEIGENQANILVLPEKIYGGATNLWGLTTVNKEDVENPSFGVTVRFKAHSNWPHASTMLIDSIEMRIH